MSVELVRAHVQGAVSDAGVALEVAEFNDGGVVARVPAGRGIGQVEVFICRINELGIGVDHAWSHIECAAWFYVDGRWAAFQIGKADRQAGRYVLMAY